jgi:purine nucleoside phosphorylase
MLAVIGGSGVYDMEGLANKRWVRVDSSFGAPSDELLVGELDGQPLPAPSRPRPPDTAVRDQFPGKHRCP